MAKRNKHTFGAWITYAGIRVFLAIIRIIPFRARVRFGGWFFRNPFGAFGARKRILKNLRHVWPDITKHNQNAIADDCLENVGRTMIENFFIREFSQHASETQAEGPGLSALLRAQSSGQPILFISGHFGNHEAVRFGLNHHGFEIGALYKPMSNPYFEEYWQKLIHINGGPMHPTSKDGIANFRSDLKNGGRLAILIDVRLRKGEVFPFLGKDAYTSNAAAAFALEADALVLPVFGLRNPDKETFRCYIDHPIEHSDPPTMIRTASAALERQIEADPGNWFWIHKRWAPFA